MIAAMKRLYRRPGVIEQMKQNHYTYWRSSELAHLHLTIAFPDLPTSMNGIPLDALKTHLRYDDPLVVWAGAPWLPSPAPDDIPPWPRAQRPCFQR